MNASAILLMILFIVVIWGGLVLSTAWLYSSDDAVTGELGDAPGTDDESLMRRAA
ncbi:methionine/alanine import NSS transporter subunit MetS [uncultured Corynebacterium sp.]|uniref:methionine/alanine import NSS transporter subunit MetS n=1 Tax=uncultured Corynebacterium sp. TaxID=159447 RepID=UPI0025DA67F5|nr:methionine/alanine import NSS transporter subunit MetS [uncultured Corynebacterium sp.]